MPIDNITSLPGLCRVKRAAKILAERRQLLFEARQGLFQPARQRLVAPVEGLKRFEDRSRFVVLQVPFNDGTAELARRDPEGLRLPDEFGKRLSGEPEANCHVFTSPRSEEHT